MKKLTKTLLISGMAALAFGSVAAGTTYALFTSEAKNDVTITVGKVSVSTKVELIEAYHPAGIDTDGTISDSTNDVANSDLKVEIAEDGKVSIDKMLPGDKVTLKVTPTNDSDVKIKYRETYEVEGNEVDGADLLKITGDEDMVKNWTVLEAGGEIDAYEVVIELPATETKRVDEVTIKLGLEAVQGNAAVYDVAVSSKDELVEVLNTTGEDISVKLSNDIALDSSIAVVSNNITLIGDGTTKLSVPETYKEGRVLDIDADNYDAFNKKYGTNIEKKINLTLSGVDVVGPKDNTYNRGISIWGMDEVDVTLDNCNVSANHYPVNIAAANKNVTLTIRNSTIAGYCAMQTWSDVAAVFENCTLVGENVYEYDKNGDNDFAIIKVVGFVENDKQYAETADFTFKGCKFYSYAKKETSGDNVGKYNTERILSVGKGLTKGKVSFDENCKFYATVGEKDSIEVEEIIKMCEETGEIEEKDLGGYFGNNSPLTVDINIKKN